MQQYIDISCIVSFKSVSIHSQTVSIQLSCIVACFNEIIVHCGQPKWCMMFLKEKKHHIFATQNNVLTPLCIEQYIIVS